MPPFAADAKNNLRAIRSRSGHTVTLDDTDGAEKIEIVDKSGKNSITLSTKDNTLTIKGERKEENGADREVLYRGIAGRAFERRFQLADHVEVRGAALENGLLHVDLVREVPEALKPRKIEISTSGQGKAKVKQIDAAAA